MLWFLTTTSVQPEEGRGFGRGGKAPDCSGLDGKKVTLLLR